MNLIFFGSKREPFHQHGLLSAIRHALPAIEIKTFTDYRILSDWLQIPPRNFFAAILIPDNRKALSELVSLKRFFTDRKIIVAVPDNNKQSIALVHQFNPHYIQWTQDDYRILISVLENWLTAEQDAGRWIENFRSTLY